MSGITIQIKNMAGDLFPMEVPAGTKVGEVGERLSEMDSQQFPHFRTRVLRMSEEKEEKEEVVEGEVLFSFVSEKIKREDVVDPDSKHIYNRFAIPIAGRIFYLYPGSHTAVPASKGRVICCRGSFSKDDPRWDPKTMKYLGVSLRDWIPTITKGQIKAVYDIIDEFYETGNFREKYHHEYPPNETYECACGSILQRRSTFGHVKKKKHQAYLNSVSQ